MINPVIETNDNGDCFLDADVYWRFVKSCTVVGDNNMNEHVSCVLLPNQTGSLLVYTVFHITVTCSHMLGM